MYQKQDGSNGKTLLVDDTEYKLTPGLLVLITNKHPRAGQWNSNDYQVYKSLHKPRLNLSRIGDVLLDHTLHGNGRICSRKI